MLDYGRRFLFILFMLIPFGTLGGQLFASSIYVVACLFAAILVLVAQKPVCRLTTLAVVAPLLLCLYVLLQLTLLPPSLLKILSPLTWSAYSETVWAVSPDQWMPLAVYSAATTHALLFLIATAGFTLTFTSKIQNRAQFNTFMQQFNVVVALWATGAISLSFMLIVFPEKLLDWQAELFECRERLNIWSAFFAPIILTNYSTQRPKITRLPVIDQMRDFIQSPGEAPYICSLVTLLLVLISLLFGGNHILIYVCLFACLICLFANYAMRKSRLSVLKWLTGGVLVSLVGFVVWGHGVVSGAFAWFFREASVSLVNTPWALAWFGSGLGGNKEIMPLATLFGGKEQVLPVYGGLVELWYGLGGWGILLTFFLLLLAGHYAQTIIIQASGSTSKRYYTGSIASLCLLATAGFYLPYINWQMLIMGGWVVILIPFVARLSRHPEQHPSNHRFFSKCLAGVLLVLFVSFFLYAVMFYVGEYYVWKTEKNVESLHAGNLQASEVEDLLKQVDLAMDWIPFLATNSQLNMFKGQLEYIRGTDVLALRSFEKSVLKRPLDPQTLIALIGVYSLSDNESDALALLKSTPMKRLQVQPFVDRIMARVLDNGVTTVEQAIIQVVLNGGSENIRKYLSLMLLDGWDLSSVERLLPSYAQSWLAYADVLLAFDKVEKAEEVFLKAITLGPFEAHHNELPYGRIAEHFLENGQTSKALLVASAALDAYPDDVQVSRLVADVYTRLGHNSAAEKELVRARMLERNNP